MWKVHKRKPLYLPNKAEQLKLYLYIYMNKVIYVMLDVIMDVTPK